MVRTGPTAWAALLLGAAVLPGCSPHFARGLAPLAKLEPVLAVTPRFAIEPDLTALPTTLNPPGRPPKYRNLTAAECRTFAIRNAPFADDLDRHPDNAAPHHPHVHSRKAESARLAAQVRGHTADELRNRAAGEALAQFFELARAEGQFDLLALAHVELTKQLDAATKADSHGFTDRTRIDALRTQQGDVEAQIARLDAAIGQLNASLRARLGIAAGDPLPLWPDDPLKVRPEDVDPERAVATGLHYRPELNALRVLAADDAAGAEELRRQVLAGVNPLLAMSAKAAVPLLGAVEWLNPKAASKPDSARQSLLAVLAAREQQAEAEIRAAVLELHGQRAAVIAKAAEVRRCAEAVAEWEKRQNAGQRVTAELAKAKLDHLKARGEVLAAATAWNAAEVKLRQSMGILVRE